MDTDVTLSAAASSSSSQGCHTWRAARPTDNPGSSSGGGGRTAMVINETLFATCSRNDTDMVIFERVDDPSGEYYEVPAPAGVAPEPPVPAPVLVPVPAVLAPEQPIEPGIILAPVHEIDKDVRAFVRDVRVGDETLVVNSILNAELISMVMEEKDSSELRAFRPELISRVIGPEKFTTEHILEEIRRDTLDSVTDVTGVYRICNPRAVDTVLCTGFQQVMVVPSRLEHANNDLEAPATISHVESSTNKSSLHTPQICERVDTRLFDLKDGEGPAIEVCGSPSTSTINQYQTEWATKKIWSPSNQMPNYDIVLSYSDEEIDFVRQLHMNLKSSNYTPMFVDQDSKNTTNKESFKTAILETTEQHCQLAIIVLSKGYLTSKRSMLELSTFWKWKSTNNPTLKLFPLFYKLTSSDLDVKKVEMEWNKSWKQLVQDGEVQEEEIFLWSKAVKSLLDARNGDLERTKALLKHLIQGKVEVEKFCIFFNEFVKDLWVCDGLDFEHYGNSIVEYLSAAIEIISINMPPTKENKTNQSFGDQYMLEMQSKLSLQKIEALLEKEPSLQKHFFFQKANILQQKYMGWNTFEEMCSDNISQKNDMLKQYGRGRVTATLFPNAFLYYFKALMLFGALYFDHDTDYLPVLIDAANMVAKRWKDLSGHGHQSFYVDVDACIDVGPILSLEGIVALCKNFEDGEGEFGYPQANISKQYGIVQDDLTGVFYCGRVEASALGEPIHTEAIGVIGVKLTSTNIHIEDMSEDGSYYFGILEDFSYEFGHDQNDGDPIHKQCAAIAFGDLGGADFLKQKHGIKCSPLLLIALACASQRKGLKLNWNDKYGHMEIDPKLVYSQPSELKGNECQILFTSKIKELGVAVEWGMDSKAPNSQFSGTTSHCNQVQKIGGIVDKAQKQTAYESQIVDTSNKSINIQDRVAVYQAAHQDKKKISVEGKGLGSGGSVSWEWQDPKAHELKTLNQEKLFEYHWRGEGGYVERNVPDAKHGAIETHLIQGALPAAKLNYLVVYDDIRKSHVSIYGVREGEGEDELEFITDMFLKKGREQCEEIFKQGLKGRDLIINRVSTVFTSITPANNKLTGYFLHFKKTFKKTNIVDEKMIELLDLGPNGSKDEWEHLIGLQKNFSGEKKFWWQASFMQAILCSRTRFSTGKLLTTRTSVERGNRIGHCQEELDAVNPADYVLGTTEVEVRGKFSQAPASQGARFLYWGGLSNENLQ